MVVEKRGVCGRLKIGNEKNHHDHQQKTYEPILKPVSQFVGA